MTRWWCMCAACDWLCLEVDGRLTTKLLERSGGRGWWEAVKMSLAASFTMFVLNQILFKLSASNGERGVGAWEVGDHQEGARVSRACSDAAGPAGHPWPDHRRAARGGDKGGLCPHQYACLSYVLINMHVCLMSSSICMSVLCPHQYACLSYVLINIHVCLMSSSICMSVLCPRQYACLSYVLINMHVCLMSSSICMSVLCPHQYACLSYVLVNMHVCLMSSLISMSVLCPHQYACLSYVLINMHVCLMSSSICMSVLCPHQYACLSYVLINMHVCLIDQCNSLSHWSV